MSPDRLGAHLIALADDKFASSDGERVFARVERKVKRRRRVGATCAGVLLATSGFGVAAWIDNDGARQHQSPVAQTQIARPDGLFRQPGVPCPGAEHASSVAQLRSANPIWTPADMPVTDAWTCAGTPVLLSNDVQISYEAGWTGIDVLTKFAELGKILGGTISQVLRRPALIVPAGTGDAGGNAMVMVVIGDTLVRFVGVNPDVPIEKLVSLAKGMRLPTSLQ